MLSQEHVPRKELFLILTEAFRKYLWMRVLVVMLQSANFIKSEFVRDYYILSQTNTIPLLYDTKMRQLKLKIK